MNKTLKIFLIIDVFTLSLMFYFKIKFKTRNKILKENHKWRFI